MADKKCDACSAVLKDGSPVCPRCGLPVKPERDGYIPFLGMHFRTAMIILTVLCIGVAIWLPRTIS